jgi:hypothetical protein
MELEVMIGKDSLAIPIENPFQFDMDDIVSQIEHFTLSKGTSLAGLDVRGLIPKMVRGIAGCERGCPSNALDLVDKGFKKFKLAYVEGGILTAKAEAETGNVLFIKMFPDF